MPIFTQAPGIWVRAWFCLTPSLVIFGVKGGLRIGTALFNLN